MLDSYNFKNDPVKHEEYLQKKCTGKNNKVIKKIQKPKK
jgi:hypothetical protein